MKKHIDITQIGKDLISDQLVSLQKLVNHIDDSFRKVVELIANNSGRLIIIGLGKSGIIGRKIVATLNSTGTLSSFIHASDALHGDLGNINDKDIVLFISNSGNTQEVKQLVPIIKSMNLKIIGMTGQLDSYLALHADFILDVSIDKEAGPNNLVPTTSTTAQLIMGDALAISLLRLQNFSREDFAKLHPGGILGNKLNLTVDSICDYSNKPMVSLNDTFQKVIMEISSNRLGATAVLDGKEIIGIITDGDLRRMLQEEDDIQNIFAKDLMSKLPKTIDKGELAYEAFSILKKNNITQLIVTHESEYIGIIHLHDILKHNLF
tara:strand:+ start:312 stop:1277 length:966 start_codon:yes stop_codon:yes gene_type:complete